MGSNPASSTIKITKCPTAYVAPTSGGTISDEDRAKIRNHDDTQEARVALAIKEKRYYTSNIAFRNRITTDDVESLLYD